MIDVEWAPGAQSVFLVQIQVEALDRNGLLSDVPKVLSGNHVNILSANVATTDDRTAKSRFAFEMAEPSHLAHVLRAVQIGRASGRGGGEGGVRDGQRE